MPLIITLIAGLFILLGAAASDALITYTFANAKVTVTDIMKVEDSASYPNYVPATELGYESIPADYEWFFQYNEQMKDIPCE